MKTKWAVACAVPIFGVLFALASGCSGTQSQVKEFQRMDVGEGPGDVMTHLIRLQKEAGDQRIVAHPPPAVQGENSGVPPASPDYPSDVSAGGLSMSRETSAMHDVMPAVPPLGTPPLMVQTNANIDNFSDGIPAVPADAAPQSSSQSAHIRPPHPTTVVSVSPGSVSPAENTPRETAPAPANTAASPEVPPSPSSGASPVIASHKPSVPDGNTPASASPVTSHMTMKKRAIYKNSARETGSPISTLAPSVTENKKAKIPEFTGGPDYQIGPDDVLHVDVWGNVELTGDVTVRPDGKISMPLIQDVQAEGLTSGELSNQIKNKLSAFLTDPTVSVIIKQVNSSKFFLIGYVANPGTYPLRGDITVLQAISLGGGFTPFASPKKLRLVRNSNGKQDVRIINYYDIIEKGGEGNYILKPGDTLVVP